MAILVLEQTFERPLTDQDLSDAARRMDRCLQAHGARWMRSYVSKDRKRMICEFEAKDAEQIRDSARSAGIPFDRCWTADLYSRDNPPAHQ
jgi:uncharacterized protein DUF4242